MKYERFSYIYPPRPKNPINPEELNSWDNNTLLAQPKLNGSNCVIFMNGQKFIVMNRHNQYLTNFNISQFELNSIFRGDIGKWIVLNGEYLNKSKKDETETYFNHKLAIFDILVYNSEYLVGQTFEQRVKLLDDLFGKNYCEKSYLNSISENIFKVETYTSEFKSHYDNLSKIDMIEGLVLKRRNAKLELGTSENNNTKSQLKVRKPTKLYKF